MQVAWPVKFRLSWPLSEKKLKESLREHRKKGIPEISFRLLMSYTLQIFRLNNLTTAKISTVCQGEHNRMFCMM